MTREEALKIVRENYPHFGTTEPWLDLEKALATLIPELAESEDERIRKWLYDYFSTIKKMIWIHRDITCEQILDWLEKQKDSVSNNFDDVWNEEDCEEIIAEGQKLTPRFKKLLKEVCHAWYDRGSKLEKQKEQKKEKFPPYVTGFKGHPDPAGTSDLEEAAEKYIQGSMCDLDDGPTVGLAKEAFIAGAEWQARQLLKGSPLPEDTVLFHKGVEEGKRLMMEDAARRK